MLTDGQILLRKYRPTDIDLLYNAVRESVTELTPYMPWCTAGYCRKEASDWVMSRESAWQNDEEYSLVIADLDDRLLLGGAGLNGINRFNNWANLGYWVRSSATGRGVATSAARLLASWGLQEQGFQRLEILAATDNIGSQRVAEKAGALREGVLRNRIRVHGRCSDAVIFSLVPTDLNPA